MVAMVTIVVAKSDQVIGTVWQVCLACTFVVAMVTNMVAMVTNVVVMVTKVVAMVTIVVRQLEFVEDKYGEIVCR